MEQDLEINAMSQVFQAFKDLDNGQRKRIVDWVTARFGLTEADKFMPPTNVQMVKVAAPQPEETPKPAPAAAKPAPPAGPKEIEDYHMVVDLFADANAKKVMDKIILMAAFVQERLNIKEFTSYELNTRLKRINHVISNITSSINGILDKKPSLMKVVFRSGETQKGRRRFSLTEEGLKYATNLLK